MSQSNEPSEYAAVGAGVGLAGAANTIALVGLTAGTIAALPIAALAGAIGGLVWWAARSAKDS